MRSPWNALINHLIPLISNPTLSKSYLPTHELALPLLVLQGYHIEFPAPLINSSSKLTSLHACLAVWIELTHIYILSLPSQVATHSFLVERASVWSFYDLSRSLYWPCILYPTTHEWWRGFDSGIDH
jgi:hypothetical protein